MSSAPTSSRLHARLGPVALLPLALIGCSRRLPVTPLDSVHHIAIRQLAVTARDQRTVAANDARLRFVWPWQQRSTATAVRMTIDDKIHPLLRRWAVDSAGREIEMLVTFRDKLPAPGFPRLDPTLPRTDSVNVKRLQQAQAAIATIQMLRAPRFAADTAGFRVAFDAAILETFWVTQTIRIRARAGKALAIARRPSVTYVRPRFADEGPPSGPPNTDPSDDIGQGLWLTGVSAAWLPWMTSPAAMIGVLDTGASPNWAALGPHGTSLCSNCVNGGADCRSWANAAGNAWLVEPDSLDACADGHGTSTASILSGRDVLPTRSQGVTRMPLENFKVYVPGSGTCGLVVDAAAAKRGFQAARARLDPMIVAEIAASDPSWGDLATQADASYDAGVMVIAANGNGGQVVGTVTAPANSRKAIGVGAYVVTTLKTSTSEGLGPTSPDNRIKPDVQAPTSTEAAAKGEGLFHTYSGTSGATPFAAGAGMLLHNLIAAPGGVDPGQVYALMILSGQKTYPFDNTAVTTTSLDHEHGAGHLRLPGNGDLYYGEVFLHANETHPVTIDASAAGSDRLDAALWWADSLATSSGTVTHLHSTVELQIFDFGGNLLATSYDASSVFQRASVSTGFTPGTYVLGISGHQMRTQIGPSGTAVQGQIVYWAVYVHQP